MDRLDYLKRDSFFSGVVEGNIGVDRLINMINVANNSLVVEEKGIYSIEKFLIARRLMYWQVYLHKTVISSENMLIKILKEQKRLLINNKYLLHQVSLNIFLQKDYKLKILKIILNYWIFFQILMIQIYIHVPKILDEK